MAKVHNNGGAIGKTLDFTSIDTYSTSPEGNKRNSGIWNLASAVKSAATITTFAEYVASLPAKLATSDQFGTITVAEAANYGVTLNNDILYTTITHNNTASQWNALSIYSRHSAATASVSISNTTGHNATSMKTPSTSNVAGVGFASPEAWVGTDDALALLHPDNNSYVAVMCAIGNMTETYWQRPIGTTSSNVFNNLTTAVGSNWTQANTSVGLANAVAGVTQSTVSNGPWTSSHYGPWAWHTATYANANDSLKYLLYNVTPQTNGYDSVFIFERSLDNKSYNPSHSHNMIVFYPAYPRV